MLNVRKCHKIWTSNKEFKYFSRRYRYFATITCLHKLKVNHSEKTQLRVNKFTVLFIQYIVNVFMFHESFQKAHKNLKCVACSAEPVLCRATTGCIYSSRSLTALHI
ncbi:hypothetical protein ATANTOWER_011662 [Ataeniobius toweri]|uniref:Uncharacterized protein n=1 Tax=Ataeniobius toweri TaxID=208326 RepID=A0ABU7C140_9TELE|nr:hypothetical protein [Ataeniobius toweri]